jgi:pimeloyl-ACP methyl ester carboxylesterase
VKPRLLLVPSFTELEWRITPALEQWAELAAFDTPGVGDAALPAGLEVDSDTPGELLARWREAAAELALEEIERRGWERFVIVADSLGHPTAIRVAQARADDVEGLALGHASLSHAVEGERAPMRAGVWEAMTHLARQGSESFVRYGIAQMTQGGIDEETAQLMVERFPDMELVAAMVDALGREPEPIGEELAALGLPLLLAKHDGCLGHTDEGFDDAVAAFSDAQTVICPETCSSSPAMAEALRTFCGRLAVAP